MKRVPLKKLSGPLAESVLSLYAIQALNYLAPLLVLPFLLRALGPNTYGSIVMAQAVIGYIAILVEFGFNFTAARDISVARDDPRQVARIYWTTLSAKLLLLLAGGVLLLLAVVVVPSFRIQWPIYVVSSALLVGNVAFPQWYLQGLERLKDVAVTQVVAKCIVSGAVIFCVHGPQDAWIAALLLASPQVVGTIAALMLRKRLAPTMFYRPTLMEIKAAMSRSWHMFAASASTTLYLQANTLVLGLMCGERAVALYSIGIRVAATLQSLVTPVTQAVFPRASQLFAEQPTLAWALVKRLALILVPVLAAIGLLTAAFAPLIVHIVGGEAFAAAVSVVRIMAPIPLFVTIAILLSQIVMVNIGAEKGLPRIYLLIGILNLAVLFPFIKLAEEQGAAWALLIAESIGPLLMARSIWKQRLRARPEGSYLPAVENVRVKQSTH